MTMQTFNVGIAGGMKVTAELISALLDANLTGLDIYGGSVYVEEVEAG